MDAASAGEREAPNPTVVEKDGKPEAVPGPAVEPEAVEASVDPLSSLSVAVRSFEKWSGGYVCFVMKVSVTERSWVVTHRYSDFAALRMHLLREFAESVSVRVPELPPKGFFRSFDAQFLNQRQIGLQRFLDEAMPLLIDYDSMALRQFLEIDAHIAKNVSAMSRLYTQSGSSSSGGGAGGSAAGGHRLPPAPTLRDRERLEAFRLKNSVTAADAKEQRPFLTIDTIRRVFGYADFAQVKGTPAQQHAAAVIQKHVRGRQASNETRRRHQWKVFRELDLSEDADMLSLACFFHTVVDELDYTKLLPQINDTSGSPTPTREPKMPREVSNYGGIIAEDDDGKFRLPPGPLSNEARASILFEALQSGFKISRRVSHQLLVEAYDLLRSQPNVRHVAVSEVLEPTTTATVAATAPLPNGKGAKPSLRSSFGKAAENKREKARSGSSHAVTVTVLGDVHGQLQDLLYILDQHGLPSATNKYIFNGDFVDRGPNGAEIVLLLYALLLAWPESVYLNRGNHEDVYLSHAYGFREEVREKYGELTFNMFAETFRWLPIASVINNEVFVVHGGLFHRMDVLLAHLNRIPRADFTPDARIKDPPDLSMAFDPALHSADYVPPKSLTFPELDAPRPPPARRTASGSAFSSSSDAPTAAAAAAIGGSVDEELQNAPLNPRVREELKEIMRDALWSDPTEEHDGIVPPIRGTGVCFGRNAVKAFLRLNGLSLVVRSHECCPDGYLRIMPGPELGSPGMLVTIFSASNYCGAGNDGAVMKFHLRQSPPRGQSPAANPKASIGKRVGSASKMNSNASLSSLDSNQATPTPSMGSGHGSLVAEGSRLRFTVWTHFVGESNLANAGGGGAAGEHSGASERARASSSSSMLAARNAALDEKAVMAREKEEGLERKNEVMLKGLLLKKREELKAAFEAADPQHTGTISRLQWAEVMENVVGIRASWMLLLPKLVKEDCLKPGEDGEILVNYRAYMDTQRTDQMDLCHMRGQDLLDFRETFMAALYAHKDKLEVIFKFFDRDGDGLINEDEFKLGCDFINTLLPPELRLKDVAKLPQYMHARNEARDKHDKGAGVDINHFLESYRLADNFSRTASANSSATPALAAEQSTENGALPAAAAAALLATANDNLKDTKAQLPSEPSSSEAQTQKRNASLRAMTLADSVGSVASEVIADEGMDEAEHPGLALRPDGDQMTK